MNNNLTIYHDNPQLVAWNHSCKRDLFCKIALLASVLFLSIAALKYNITKMIHCSINKIPVLPSYAYLFTPIVIEILVQYNRRTKSKEVHSKIMKDAEDYAKYSKGDINIASILTWMLFAPFAFLKQLLNTRAYYIDTVRWDTSLKLNDPKVTFEKITFAYASRNFIFGNSIDWDQLLSYGFIKEDGIKIDDNIPIREWLFYKAQIIIEARERLQEMDEATSGLSELAEQVEPYDINSGKPRTLPQEYKYQLDRINKINEKWDEIRSQVCYKYAGGSEGPTLIEKWLLDTEEAITLKKSNTKDEEVDLEERKEG